MGRRQAKKNRILHLYGLMDGTVDAQLGDPDAVVCVDEIGRSTFDRTRAGSGPLLPVVG